MHRRTFLGFAAVAMVGGCGPRRARDAALPARPPAPPRPAPPPEGFPAIGEGIAIGELPDAIAAGARPRLRLAYRLPRDVARTLSGSPALATLLTSIHMTGQFPLCVPIRKEIIVSSVGPLVDADAERWYVTVEASSVLPASAADVPLPYFLHASLLGYHSGVRAVVVRGTPALKVP